MTKKQISNLAASVSGGMDELASNMPERDPLRDELSRLSARIDERFGLVTVRCPIEPA
jgi:hypothetical protein